MEAHPQRGGAEPASTAQERLRRAVERVEEGSSVEVVVRWTRACGPYRDVDLAFAAFSAALILAAMVAAPFEISDLWLFPATTVAFAAGWLLSSRTAFVRKRFSSPARRRLQVENGAILTFHRAHVDATRGRTGVLIFASELERDLAVIADHGVASAVPGAFWNRLRQRVLADPSADLLERLAVELEAAADELRARLPRAANDVNELDDAVLAVRIE
jgi:uncharacterized membrane protein